MGSVTIPVAAPRVEFGLLGALEVRVEGRLATIGSRQQRLVLLELLLRPGEAVGSDKIIDDLWGERPPRTAAKALQVHVSQLRRVLEEPGTAGAHAQVLVTQAPGYALRLDSDAVDVQRFERLLDEGRAALAAGAADVAAGRLRAGLALWRGPPLGDLAFEPFAEPVVARLEERRLDALETRIDADLAMGATGLAAELEALVREHPLRERLRGQLMLALYRAGRQPDALEAYREARRTLVEALGIEPGPALRRLHAAILAQDDVLEASARSVPPRVQTLADDFVGRDRELAQLAAGLDRALAGTGSLVVIGGEPGVGKTRLVERVAAAATARGALVVGSRCWEAGGAPAYWPWVEALRAFADAEGIEAVRRYAGPGASDIARILPELAQVTGEMPPAADAEGARFRLFEAVGRFFAYAARARPLVLAIDDLQAADTPSLLLLRFLAPRLAAIPVLAVVTYRDTEVVPGGDLASALADVGRSPSTRRLALGGFGEDEVGRFIETIAGREPAGLARLLLTETEGNPLFTGELVRLLVAEGGLDAAAGATAWDFGVPDELRDVIGRRLDGLSEVTREVLGVASVLGRELRIDALELVSGASRDALADAIDEAAGRRVAAPVPGDPRHLRFSHALIRDVAYDRLRAAERRRLHTAAGEALEVVYSPDVDSHSAELAHHFCLAAAVGGDVGRAVRHALRAGGRAVRLVAFEEAIRLFELALRTLGPSADVAMRCDVLLALGEAIARSGDSDAAKQRFLEAAELARRADMPERLARAAIGYGGRFLWARGTTDAHLVPLLDDALEALGTRDDRLRVQILARLAGALRPGSGRPVGDRRAGREGALERGAQAVEGARRLGDPAALAYAIEGYVLAMWAPGNAPERIHRADEVVAISTALGDRERLFAAHEHLLGSWWELADLSHVEAGLGTLEQLADELCQPGQRWMAGSYRTIFALSQGRVEEAERLAFETLEHGRGTQTWNALVSHQMHLFTLRRLQGRLAELEPSLAAAVREFPSYELLRSALAYLYVATGDRERGAAIFEDLAADDLAGFPRDEDWQFGIALAGETCALLGDADRAATLYSLLAPYRDLVSMGVPDGSDDAVARSLGVLAMTLGRHDEAIADFRHGIAIDERMGARPAVTRGEAALADALRRRGDSGDAAEAAALDARAAATCRELGLAG